MKRRHVRKSDLVGRTITDVRWNRWPTGRGTYTTDPEIILSSGKVLRFVAEETEVGEYGVRVVVYNPQNQ